MGVFDDAAADIFADEDVTIAASFRRPPGVWQPVRLIRSQPSEDLGPARARAFLVDLLASEIDVPPARHDRIRIDGTIRRVEEAEPDDLGLSWRLTLSDPVAS